MCIACELEYITTNFVLLGPKWGASQSLGTSGETVTFSFASQNFFDQFYIFDSFITTKAFQDAIKESFAVWESVADIRFIHSEDNRNVDIRFGWLDIDGPGRILGQTTIPAIGPLSGVLVGFDINENWFVSGDDSDSNVNFSTTAIHEIGHAIGIGHSELEGALMNANYSRDVDRLHLDDVNAVVEIYGATDIVKIDVDRFFNPLHGGHLFTADIVEKDVLNTDPVFISEGVGFKAISKEHEFVEGSVPVHRFYNSDRGSHFFTAFEEEKAVLTEDNNFVYEGVAFRAFELDSSTTQPVHRFFNTKIGGAFFHF